MFNSSGQGNNKKAFEKLKVIIAKKPVVKFLSKKGHYLNYRCKRTFNIWNIIRRRLSNNVFIKKINKQ